MYEKSYKNSTLCAGVFGDDGSFRSFCPRGERGDAKGQKDGLHWSLGLSSEGNMNVPKGYALGSGLYGLIVFPEWVKTGRFSAGVKLLYSTEFKRYGLFDTALLFRWNFYDFSKPKKPDSGFFIQAEGGVSLG